MSDFDNEYSQSTHYFGEEPEAVLLNFLNEINPAHPVLDVGCGQGRNSFTLAWHKIKPFRVLAIDPSKKAVKSVQIITNNESLPITTSTLGFENIDENVLQNIMQCRLLSAVLFFGILPIITIENTHRYIDKATRLLAKDGLIFITAFSTEGPDFIRHQQTWESIDRQSFRNPDNHDELCTYFAPNEILKLFDRNQFCVIHHRECLGPMHKHTETGAPHQHAMIELVARAR